MQLLQFPHLYTAKGEKNLTVLKRRSLSVLKYYFICLNLKQLSAPAHY